MELFSSYGVTPYFSQRDSSSDITLMIQSSLMNQPGSLWPTQKSRIPKIQKSVAEFVFSLILSSTSRITTAHVLHLYQRL